MDVPISQVRNSRLREVRCLGQAQQQPEQECESRPQLRQQRDQEEHSSEWAPGPSSLTSQRPPNSGVTKAGKPRQGATCHFCPDDRPRFPASPDPAWVALDQETQGTVGCGFPYLIPCCILLVGGLALLPLGQKGSLPCRSSLLDPGLGFWVLGPVVSLKLPLWRCSLRAPVPC